MLGMRPAGGTQAFSALGRETFITAARWVDGWLEIDPVVAGARAPARSGVDDDFDGEPLSPEWISVRRYPTELATAATGRRVALTGDGSTLDDPRPVFVAAASSTSRCGCPCRSTPAPASAGSPSGSTSCTTTRSRSAAAWSPPARRSRASGRNGPCPAPSDVVTLHLDCEPPTGNKLLDILTSDIVVLGVTDADGNGRVELARVDGRYLSQETAASFTGRVIGVYAVRGSVTFSQYRYAGWED